MTLSKPSLTAAVTHPVLVLQLNGSQAEQGRQHGALLQQVGGHEEAMAYYPGLPQRLLEGGTRRTPIEARAVAATRPLFEVALRALDRRRPHDLRERSQAFSVALGQRASMARYLGVMDVFQNALGLLAKVGRVPLARRLGAVAPPACSTLASWGSTTDDGRMLHARNFDFPGIGVWERAPVVAFCTPTAGLRYGFVATRGADLPGITAFNEAGLTLTMHTRFHADVGLGRLAVDLGHEIIRRASSLAEATAIAREARVASTWGLLVSSAAEESAVLLETTARAVEVVSPTHGEAWLATTNHYRHPALQVDEVAPSAAWTQHTVGRLRNLHRWAQRGGLSAMDLQHMLGDHRDPDGDHERAAGGVLGQPLTVQSIVADPSRRQVHVSAGDCPTGRGTFQCIDWTWEDSPGAIVVQPTKSAAHPSRYATGDEALAHGWYVEACRREELPAPPTEIEDAIRSAITLDPTDPSYRFLGAAYRLRRGDHTGAVDDVRIGLAHEASTFRRGQLLLWGARAAAARGDGAQASAWRRTLLELRHPLLVGHRTAALRELRGAKGPRLRDLPVNAGLLDAG